MTPALIHRSAQIDGEYRYVLWRSWPSLLTDGDCDLLTFVMLNPSTADGSIDDPTIRRCMGFADREGASMLNVVNLYALRSTNPGALANHPDPVGIGNDALLRAVACQRDRFKTVVAWGAHRMATPERTAVLVDEARRAGTTLWCLGTTKSGAPKHPLYVPASTPLEPWIAP